MCSGLPWAYGRALARAPCSDLGERWSRGRVDEAVAKPEPPMLLALSHPHDDLSIKVLGARIMVWPMDRPCRRRVLTDAGVDARVRVRLGRVRQVEGDVGRRLALVGQNPCLELGARLATM